MDMIPDGHAYEDDVRFSTSFTSDYVAEGDYEAHFWFADDDIENYPIAQIVLPITVGGGGGGAGNYWGACVQQSGNGGKGIVIVRYKFQN